VQRDRRVEVVDPHAEFGGRVLRADQDRVLAAAEIEIGDAVARIAQRRRSPATATRAFATARPSSFTRHLDRALARPEVEVDVRERAAPHADLLLLRGSAR
jgi:hypothetical protein